MYVTKISPQLSTGTEELNVQRSSRSVFPNPAVDMIILSDAAPNETFRIFTNDGRLAHVCTAPGPGHSERIGHLPEGVYLLRGSEGNAERLVVQR
jgi:hypothetical protein